LAREGNEAAVHLNSLNAFSIAMMVGGDGYGAAFT
jgi:hypothetical protein